ncbi:MAG: 3'(2'),5'-bisphosphate nucleotidase CysQ [Shimia sp.]
MPGPDTRRHDPARDDAALLADAARAAGEIALRHFRTDVEVVEKPGGLGPVTAADLAVNAYLDATLRTARPDYGWLSEESAPDPARRTARRTFVVDPIDGTRAFIAGQSAWGVALAVVEDGHPIAAAIAMPVRGWLYTAAAGRGAFRDGTPLRVAPSAPLEATEVLTSKPMLGADRWDRVPPVRRSYRPSLAYRMALVAEGRMGAMLTLRPTWEWDVAAGTLLVGEAGGAVVTGTGARPAFDAPDPRLPGLIAGPVATVEALLAHGPKLPPGPH